MPAADRERESLVGEQNGIISLRKAARFRLGDRGRSELKGPPTPDGLHTPEGEPIPPNTLAELRRDMSADAVSSDPTDRRSTLGRPSRAPSAMDQIA